MGFFAAGLATALPLAGLAGAVTFFTGALLAVFTTGLLAVLPTGLAGLAVDFGACVTLFFFTVLVFFAGAGFFAAAVFLSAGFFAAVLTGPALRGLDLVETFFAVLEVAICLEPLETPRWRWPQCAPTTRQVFD